MILNKILGRFKDTRFDINKYVNISKSWNVSDYSLDYIRELNNIQETIYRFAKKNNVQVDMFVPENEDILQVTVSRFNRRKKEVHSFSKSLALSSESVTMMKENNVMLEDKDGINYMAKGLWTTEDDFIRRVYRVVGELTSKIKQ